MGFDDIMSLFGDGLKGAGKGFGEALSKVGGAFSLFKR